MSPSSDIGGWDLAEPRPEALIEALRAFGYSPETAIADLVDNSVSAGAKNIDVSFHWAGAGSTVTVKDDGRGMSETQLVEAMRPGNRSPLDERKVGDLGRFGLGLKTASFSQCRELTVTSRTARSTLAARRWDLDLVGSTGEWRLLRTAAANLAPGPNRANTTVTWSKLDRLVGDARTSDKAAQTRFLRTAERVQRHLEMTFHRFLTGLGSVTIRGGGAKLRPWDPFMVDHPATQRLETETLHLRGHSITVRPLVLPHRSKLSDADQQRGAGIRGWNAQQGFYVYRADRLVIPGDWLGLPFSKEEHCKLARIAIEVPTALDHDWQIDVRKSTARPPGELADAFRRIASVTRAQAQEVYRHRGKMMVRNNSQPFVFAWQELKTRDGEIRYKVNRQHPVVEQTLIGPIEQRRRVERLLRFVEETIPVPLIGLRVAGAVESPVLPFSGRASREVRQLFDVTLEAMVANGTDRRIALARLAVTEPFVNYPELAAAAAEQDRQA